MSRSNLGGLSSLPHQLESECSKVKKQVCKDVPKKEAVMKEVEICVRKPKEVYKAKNLVGNFYPFILDL